MRPLPFAAAVTIASTMLLRPPAAVAVQRCAGDADGDTHVTVAELVLAVRHGLDDCPLPPATCNGDADGDRVVTIAELVNAVGFALTDCPAGSDLVVDVGWLVDRLDDARWQVVDGRGGAFDGGHIPGAIPLSPLVLATTREGVDFQVVGPAAGAAALSAIGLRREAGVVVYGVSPEYDAARLVWALRHLGHEDVRYLDGGWAAWAAANAPISPGPPQAADPSSYEIAAVRDDIRVTGDWVLEQLGAPPYEAATIQVVDARSPGEFAAGHIPTAVSAPWTGNLDQGLLRPPLALDTLYADLGLDPRRTTVTYCTIGWRASVDWLAFTWLGFEDVRVYDGSWLEWQSDERFPIEMSSAASR